MILCEAKSANYWNIITFKGVPMKNSTVFIMTFKLLVLSLATSTVVANENSFNPNKYILNESRAEKIESLNDCIVSASIYTNFPIIGRPTYFERASIICGDVELYFGNSSQSMHDGNRTKMILSTLIQQMRALGFKVETCDFTNKSDSTCVLTKIKNKTFIQIN